MVKKFVIQAQRREIERVISYFCTPSGADMLSK